MLSGLDQCCASCARCSLPGRNEKIVIIGSIASQNSHWRWWEGKSLKFWQATHGSGSRSSASKIGLMHEIARLGMFQSDWRLATCRCSQDVERYDRSEASSHTRCRLSYVRDVHRSRTCVDVMSKTRNAVTLDRQTSRIFVRHVQTASQWQKNACKLNMRKLLNLARWTW